MTDDEAIKAQFEHFWSVALEACKTTYKANKTPPFAALYDDDIGIRIGAALIISEFKSVSRFRLPNDVKILEQRLKTEKAERAKVVYREIIKILREQS